MRKLQTIGRGVGVVGVNSESLVWLLLALLLLPLALPAAPLYIYTTTTTLYYPYFPY